MTTDHATLTIDGPVARLALNRPEQRNALSVELLDGLHARVEELEAAPGVKVTVVTGAGRAFCAGMDLKQVVIAESGDPELPHRLLSSLGRLTLRLRALPSVVVARVNGAAIGGGCGLACVCDIAVTHGDAKLGFPEVDLGLCPAVVAPVLVRKIGPGQARRVLLSGGVMDGHHAHTLGIVDEVSDSRESLDETTDAIVGRLAAGGADALAATKSLVNRLDGSLDASVVERGARLSADVLATAEAQAILAARLEK
ncbi:MAG: enoyl-CoA hydratase/isomerase family protein [Planctomycetota bacterium]